jgi:hypothetical protein
MSIEMIAAVLLIALAATPDELLRIADAIDRDLAFDESLALLTRLLDRKDLTLEDRTQAHALSAVCHVARGDHEQAEAAYFELLMLSPTYAPEDWRAPKVKSAFERARARWQEIVPRLSLGSPEVIDGKLRIAARAVDPRALVSSVVLFSRAAHDGDWEKHSFLRTKAGFEIELAVAARTEYYAVALGSLDQELARSSAADRPYVHTTAIFTAPVPAPEIVSEAWYQKWWLWTAVGVVVAGSAIAVTVAATSGNDDELFTLRLPLRTR